jgi:hypothetical protein
VNSSALASTTADTPRAPASTWAMPPEPVPKLEATPPRAAASVRARRRRCPGPGVTASTRRRRSRASGRDRHGGTVAENSRPGGQRDREGEARAGDAGRGSPPLPRISGVPEIRYPVLVGNTRLEGARWLPRSNLDIVSHPRSPTPSARPLPPGRGGPRAGGEGRLPRSDPHPAPLGTAARLRRRTCPCSSASTGAAPRSRRSPSPRGSDARPGAGGDAAGATTRPACRRLRGSSSGSRRGSGRREAWASGSRGRSPRPPGS